MSNQVRDYGSGGGNRRFHKRRRLLHDNSNSDASLVRFESDGNWWKSLEETSENTLTKRLKNRLENSSRNSGSFSSNGRNSTGFQSSTCQVTSGSGFSCSDNNPESLPGSIRVPYRQRRKAKMSSIDFNAALSWNNTVLQDKSSFCANVSVDVDSNSVEDDRENLSDMERLKYARMKRNARHKKRNQVNVYEDLLNDITVNDSKFKVVRTPVALDPCSYQLNVAEKSSFVSEISDSSSCEEESEAHLIDMQRLKYSRKNRNAKMIERNQENVYATAFKDVSLNESHAQVENSSSEAHGDGTNDRQLKEVSHLISNEVRYGAPSSLTYCRQIVTQCGKVGGTTYVTISEIQDKDIFQEPRSCARERRKLLTGYQLPQQLAEFSVGNSVNVEYPNSAIEEVHSHSVRSTGLIENEWSEGNGVHIYEQTKDNIETDKYLNEGIEDVANKSSLVADISGSISYEEENGNHLFDMQRLKYSRLNRNTKMIRKQKQNQETIYETVFKDVSLNDSDNKVENSFSEDYGSDEDVRNRSGPRLGESIIEEIEVFPLKSHRKKRPRERLAICENTFTEVLKSDSTDISNSECLLEIDLNMSKTENRSLAFEKSHKIPNPKSKKRLDKIDMEDNVRYFIGVDEDEVENDDVSEIKNYKHFPSGTEKENLITIENHEQNSKTCLVSKINKDEDADTSNVDRKEINRKEKLVSIPTNEMDAVLQDGLLSVSRSSSPLAISEINAIEEVETFQQIVSQDPKGTLADSNSLKNVPKKKEANSKVEESKSISQPSDIFNSSSISRQSDISLFEAVDGNYPKKKRGEKKRTFSIHQSAFAGALDSDTDSSRAGSSCKINKKKDSTPIEEMQQSHQIVSLDSKENDELLTNSSSPEIVPKKKEASSKIEEYKTTTQPSGILDYSRNSMQSETSLLETVDGTYQTKKGRVQKRAFAMHQSAFTAALDSDSDIDVSRAGSSSKINKKNDSSQIKEMQPSQEIVQPDFKENDGLLPNSNSPKIDTKTKKSSSKIEECKATTQPSAILHSSPISIQSETSLLEADDGNYLTRKGREKRRAIAMHQSAFAGALDSDSDSDLSRAGSSCKISKKKDSSQIEEMQSSQQLLSHDSKENDGRLPHSSSPDIIPKMKEAISEIEDCKSTPQPSGILTCSPNSVQSETSLLETVDGNYLKKKGREQKRAFAGGLDSQHDTVLSRAGSSCKINKKDSLQIEEMQPSQQIVQPDFKENDGLLPNSNSPKIDTKTKKSSNKIEECKATTQPSAILNSSPISMQSETSLLETIDGSYRKKKGREQKRALAVHQSAFAGALDSEPDTVLSRAGSSCKINKKKDCSQIEEMQPSQHIISPDSKENDGRLPNSNSPEVVLKMKEASSKIEESKTTTQPSGLLINSPNSMQTETSLLETIDGSYRKRKGREEKRAFAMHQSAFAGGLDSEPDTVLSRAGSSCKINKKKDCSQIEEMQPSQHIISQDSKENDGRLPNSNSPEVVLKMKEASSKIEESKTTTQPSGLLINSPNSMQTETSLLETIDGSYRKRKGREQKRAFAVHQSAFAGVLDSEPDTILSRAGSSCKINKKKDSSQIEEMPPSQHIVPMDSKESGGLLPNRNSPGIVPKMKEASSKIEEYKATTQRSGILDCSLNSMQSETSLLETVDRNYLKKKGRDQKRAFELHQSAFAGALDSDCDLSQTGSSCKINKKKDFSQIKEMQQSHQIVSLDSKENDELLTNSSSPEIVPKMKEASSKIEEYKTTTQPSGILDYSRNSMQSETSLLETINGTYIKKKGRDQKRAFELHQSAFAGALDSDCDLSQTGSSCKINKKKDFSQIKEMQQSHQIVSLDSKENDELLTNSSSPEIVPKMKEASSKIEEYKTTTQRSGILDCSLNSMQSETSLLETVDRNYLKKKGRDQKRAFELHQSAFAGALDSDCDLSQTGSSCKINKKKDFSQIKEMQQSHQIVSLYSKENDELLTNSSSPEIVPKMKEASSKIEEYKTTTQRSGILDCSLNSMQSETSLLETVDRNYLKKKGRDQKRAFELHQSAFAGALDSDCDLSQTGSSCKINKKKDFSQIKEMQQSHQIVSLDSKENDELLTNSSSPEIVPKMKEASSKIEEYKTTTQPSGILDYSRNSMQSETSLLETINGTYIKKKGRDQKRAFELHQSAFAGALDSDCDLSQTGSSCKINKKKDFSQIKEMQQSHQIVSLDSKENDVLLTNSSSPEIVPKMKEASSKIEEYKTTTQPSGILDYSRNSMQSETSLLETINGTYQTKKGRVQKRAFAMHQSAFTAALDSDSDIDESRAGSSSKINKKNDSSQIKEMQPSQEIVLQGFKEKDGLLTNSNSPMIFSVVKEAISKIESKTTTQASGGAAEPRSDNGVSKVASNSIVEKVLTPEASQNLSASENVKSLSIEKVKEGSHPFENKIIEKNKSFGMSNKLSVDDNILTINQQDIENCMPMPTTPACNPSRVGGGWEEISLLAKNSPLEASKLGFGESTRGFIGPRENCRLSLFFRHFGDVSSIVDSSFVGNDSGASKSSVSITDSIVNKMIDTPRAPWLDRKLSNQGAKKSSVNVTDSNVNKMIDKPIKKLSNQGPNTEIKNLLLASPMSVSDKMDIHNCSKSHTVAENEVNEKEDGVVANIYPSAVDKDDLENVRKENEMSQPNEFLECKSSVDNLIAIKTGISPPKTDLVKEIPAGKLAPSASAVRKPFLKPRIPVLIRAKPTSIQSATIKKISVEPSNSSSPKQSTLIKSNELPASVLQVPESDDLNGSAELLRHSSPMKGLSKSESNIFMLDSSFVQLAKEAVTENVNTSNTLFMPAVNELPFIKSRGLELHITPLSDSEAVDKTPNIIDDLTFVKSTAADIPSFDEKINAESLNLDVKCSSSTPAPRIALNTISNRLSLDNEPLELRSSSNQCDELTFTILPVSAMLNSLQPVSDVSLVSKGNSPPQSASIKINELTFVKSDVQLAPDTPTDSDEQESHAIDSDELLLTVSPVPLVPDSPLPESNLSNVCKEDTPPSRDAKRINELTFDGTVVPLSGISKEIKENLVNGMTSTGSLSLNNPNVFEQAANDVTDSALTNLKFSKEKDNIKVLQQSSSEKTKDDTSTEHYTPKQLKEQTISGTFIVSKSAAPELAISNSPKTNLKSFENMDSELLQLSPLDLELLDKFVTAATTQNSNLLPATESVNSNLMNCSGAKELNTSSARLSDVNSVRLSSKMESDISSMRSLSAVDSKLLSIRLSSAAESEIHSRRLTGTAESDFHLQRLSDAEESELQSRRLSGVVESELHSRMLLGATESELHSKRLTEEADPELHSRRISHVAGSELHSRRISHAAGAELHSGRLLHSSISEISSINPSNLADSSLRPFTTDESGDYKKTVTSSCTRDSRDSNALSSCTDVSEEDVQRKAVDDWLMELEQRAVKSEKEERAAVLRVCSALTAGKRSALKDMKRGKQNPHKVNHNRESCDEDEVKRKRLPVWVKRSGLHELVEKAIGGEGKDNAEEFLFDLVDIVKKVVKSKRGREVREGVQKVQKQLFEMNIISTLSDFYNFVRDYMPFAFRERSIPCTGRNDEIHPVCVDSSMLQKPLFD